MGDRVVNITGAWFGRAPTGSVTGDGLADPWNPEDAIFSAGRYLDAAGYQKSPSRSIFAYNHAMWYVNDVLRLAKQLSPDYHC